MTTDLISLFVIVLVAAVCPLIAKLIPNKLIPETVFLIIAGALLGPNMAGAIQLTDSVDLLSDLGLAFLFLLAGYEIDPKCLTGSQGKRGLITWLVSFAVAFVAMQLIPATSEDPVEAVALTIALTTTALGTLMPILKDRELLGTRVGDATLAYGTWGELGPILAMAILLSSRAQWKTILILLAFVALCVVVAVVQSRAMKSDNVVFRFLADAIRSNSQTAVRMVVVLMVGLVALSAIFDLDIVLGAFAAGFILRYIIPEGNEELEQRLDSIAYGFFVPLFFVVSGAKIDLTAVVAQPLLLVGFIVMLFVIRAVPIYISMSTDKETKDISSHNRLTVALYCTTALPLIVAVTSVAVDAGSMTQETASVLVAAGAVTVFLMPLLASITYRVADAKPIEAAKEIAQNPSDAKDILHDHWELQRLIARQEAVERAVARHQAAVATASANAVAGARAAAAAKAKAGAEAGAHAADADGGWDDDGSAMGRESERKLAMDEALEAAAKEVARARANAAKQGGKHGVSPTGPATAKASVDVSADASSDATSGGACANGFGTGPLYGTGSLYGSYAIPEGMSEEASRELIERRREERRRHVARVAVREYDRRLAEMGRMAERMGIDSELEQTVHEARRRDDEDSVVNVSPSVVESERAARKEAGEKPATKEGAGCADAADAAGGEAAPKL